MVLAAALGVFGLAAAAEPQPPKWSEREVFDFGRVSVDMKAGLERGTHSQPYEIRNCSTAAYYCVTGGEIAHIALPKKCRTLKKGDYWSVDFVTVAVLTEIQVEPPARGARSRKAYYLIAGSPWIIYRYDPPRGVTEVYFDTSRRTDFATMAQKGTLPNPLTLNQPGTGRFSTLTTPDPFGPCRP